MNEKVTHEVRVIETEDGFRIEIKGDKEELRHMIFGGGWANLRHLFQHHHQGFGRHFFRHRDHQSEGHHHNPFEKEKGMPHGGRKHHHYDLGPWWDESTSGENA